MFAVLGDGTIGFHLAEFETAVRRGLPFVAVLGNDARWNAESQIQLRDYGANRMHGCELLPARYDQVVAALGGHGEFVEQRRRPARRDRARAGKRQACLHQRHDREHRRAGGASRRVTGSLLPALRQLTITLRIFSQTPLAICLEYAILSQL